MPERDVFHRRSVWVCLGVMVMVLATAGIILAIHLTVVTDDTDLPKPANVLFIVVDDLRPALESYGDKIVIAPNIKQLAAKSIKFNRAYCQQALCAPSRNSFLTSRRPDTLHLYGTYSYWRRDVGNFTTLPQHFKDNGFHTASIGKIFHRGEVSGNLDYPYSWSDEPYQPPTLAYKNSRVCPTKDGSDAVNLYCPVDVDKQPEGTLPDLQNTDEAVKFLKNYSTSANWKKGKPFFLGVGYYKPHIPFKFPKEYEDLYPTMALAPNRFKPAKMPDVAWNPWTDIRKRDDVKELNFSFPFDPLPDDYQILARTGYYASISYIDDLIGKLLATLEETGFAQNTMIVFTGDHGWSLGEHQEWAKYSNFDDVVRVPLLISIPHFTDKDTKSYCHIQLVGNDTLEVNQTRCIDTTAQMAAQLETYELVELVDLFPTIADIMGLPVPPLCPLDSASSLFCTEGTSLKPLIQHVISAQTFIEDFSGKTAAFSQYPRPSEYPQNNSDQPLLKDIKIMGYTMKTNRYRYTEWIQFSPSTFQGNWSAIYARELYDHLEDEKEDNNEADNPAYQDTVKELSKKLQAGWRSSLPR